MGKVWKFSDNVNTDEIIPGRYNITTNEKELARKVFFEIRPEFAENVEREDVIIAGSNFGCGSSREHAPLALKGCGVACVIAKSYARIFFRNAINIGLPILECEEAYKIDEGDEVDIDLRSGLIRDSTSHETFHACSFPEFVYKIVDVGGVVNFLKIHHIEELL